MGDVLEQLGKKKTTGLDNMKKLWLFLAAVVASALTMIFLPMLGEFASTFVLVLIVVYVYILYVQVRRINIEYEYSFSDGILDVDTIYGKQKRKRLVSINCREMELMAWSKNPEHRQKFFDESVKKQYRAVFDPKAGGVYRILFRENGEKVFLSFQPNEAFLDAIKKTKPSCVFLEKNQ